MTEEKNSQSKVVQFKVDDENKLIAVLKPKSLGNEPVNFSIEYIMSQLANDGLDKCDLYRDVLQNMVNAYFAKDKIASYVIGERKDCEFIIEQDEVHLLRAWLTIKKAKGGQEPTYELIQEVLQEAEIVFGVREDVLQNAITDGYLPKTLIAEGKSPQRGNNAKFESLLESEESPKGVPVEREDGSVDYKDLNIVQSIEAGIPLLKKYPPTIGVDGKNIKGEVIPATPGENKPFGRIKGAVILDSDPNVIVSSIAGQPYVKNNTAVVHPIFSCDGVNYSTGNIDFKGTVVVSGNVETGFSINAGGDVIVSGVVEGAEITSGGSVTLKRGVVGGGKAVIKASGNVKAKFFESATIEAQQSIAVEDVIAHSEVTATDKIIIGGQAGKGQVTGGHIRSMSLIEAKILGSESGTKTIIDVGWNPYLDNKCKEIKNEYKEKKKRLEEVIKSIIYLRSLKDDSRNEEHQGYLEERDQLLDDTAVLNEQYQELNEQLKEADKGKIVAKRQIHPGVRIIVSNTRKEIQDTYQGGASFYLKGKEIIVGPS